MGPLAGNITSRKAQKEKEHQTCYVEGCNRMAMWYSTLNKFSCIKHKLSLPPVAAAAPATDAG